MIWFFTPYSFEKRMFEAWDKYMGLVPDPEDWVCMMDGDILFLLADFGHQLQEYIDLYPGAGMFTCYASRAHRKAFIPKGTNIKEASILYHHSKAEKMRKDFQGKVKVIPEESLGHLLMMKKGIWLKIRDRVAELCAKQKILGVDVRISRAVREQEMKILLMRGVYVLHFFRMKYGTGQRDILL